MNSHEMMVFTWKQLPKKAKKHIKAWVKAHLDYREALISMDLVPDPETDVDQGDVRIQMALRHWWRGTQAALACEKWLPKGGGKKFGLWMMDREYGHQFPDPLFAVYNVDWDSMTEEEYRDEMMEIPS